MVAVAWAPSACWCWLGVGSWAGVINFRFFFLQDWWLPRLVKIGLKNDSLSHALP